MSGKSDTGDRFQIQHASDLGEADRRGAEVALYDRMCLAIAECSRVDEAKDIRDKAMALEMYNRQARNLDAEREAANIRLRAERRAGELLKELARATPREVAQAGGAAKAATSKGETKQQTAPSAYAATLADLGMSRQTANRYQAVAEIPEAVFEEALAAPDKTSTSALIRQSEARDTVLKAGPKPSVTDNGLSVWGFLCDLEKEGHLTTPASEILAGMTPQMRADVERIRPAAISFLKGLHE